MSKKGTKNVAGYRAVLRLAEGILARMAELQVTQAKLAELTGSSKSTVSRWFSPGRNLTVFTAAMIADALGAELHFELVDRAASRRNSEPQRIGTIYPLRGDWGDDVWEMGAIGQLDATAVAAGRSNWRFERPAVAVVDETGSLGLH